MQHRYIGLGLVFAAGYYARTTSQPRTANPAEEGTRASSAWLAGWDEADRLRAFTATAASRNARTASAFTDPAPSSDAVPPSPAEPAPWA
jgi:hypothetical protein